MRKISSDEKAKASFAMVAVVILLLGSVSVVYLSLINNDYRNSQIENKEISKMNNAADKLHQEIETEFFNYALEAIYEATQLAQPNPDQKQINKILEEKVERYFDNTQDFPRRDGNIEIEVTDYNIGVYFSEKNTKDIISNNETHSKVISVEGKSATVEELDTDSAWSFDETSDIAYYEESGYINYTVKIVNTDDILEKSMPIERKVKTPYPLLKNRMDRFKADVKDSNSDFGRMIKYILTTVAQYRVLQGYGMVEIGSGGSFSVKGVNSPANSIDDILTEEDVELAVNLALLLKMIRTYRAWDPDIIPSFDDENNYPVDTNPNYEDYAFGPRVNSMEEIMETWIDNGSIDAMDIIALFNGLQDETINLEAIIAQAINTLIDQFLLKYFDFLGLMPLIEEVWEDIYLLKEAWDTGVDFVQGFLSDVEDFLLSFIPDSWKEAWDNFWGGGGTTVDKEQVDTVKTWVEEKFLQAGLENTEIMRESWPTYMVDYDLDDVDEELYARNPDDDLDLNTLPDSIDTYPTYDIPSHIYTLNYVTTVLDHTYPHGPHSTGGNPPSTYYDTGYVYLKKVYRYEITLDDNINGGDPHLIDWFWPVDITGDGSRDSLWQDFYSQYYGDTTGENEASLIKQTLHDTIKSVVMRVVEVILSTGDLPDLIKDDYLLDTINPTDEKTILHMLEQNVNHAIDNTIDYFKENPTDILDVLSNLMKSHRDLLSDFKDFFKANYDEFAYADEQREYVEKQLAHHLIWNHGSVNGPNEISSQFIDTGHNPAGWSWDGSSPPSGDFMKGWLDSETSQGVYGGNPYISNVIQYSTHTPTDEVYQMIKQREIDEFSGNSVSNQDGVVVQALKYIMYGKSDGEEGFIDSGVGDSGTNLFSLEAEFLDIFTGCIDTVAGFSLFEDAKTLVKKLTSAIIINNDFANIQFFQPIRPGTTFEFWEGDYSNAKENDTILTEVIVVDQDPNYLNHESSHLNVDISDPHGTHYTSVTEFNSRPFETQWNVSITGSYFLSTRCNNFFYLLNGTHDYTWENSTVDIEIEFPIVVYSGWALGDRNNYVPTETLLSCITAFLNVVWDHAVKIVGPVIDTLMIIVDFISNALQTLVSYATRIIKFVADIIQFFVELAQQFVRNILDTFALAIIETLIDVLQLNDRPLFSLYVYGFYINITANTKGLKEPNDIREDIITIRTEGNILETDLSFNISFVKLPESSKSKYDLLINGTIHHSLFTLNLLVDPLMAVWGHVVEGHGYHIDESTEDGWGLEFYLPEVEDYREIGFKLSDLQGGVPITVPTPIGLEASFDAGINIKYGSPDPVKPIINEFESNSGSGTDDKEWFELYVPDSVSWSTLQQYSIRTQRGYTVEYKLGDIHDDKDGNYYVFEFPSQVLNDGELWDVLNSGDGLILLDEDGGFVDKTPVKIDSDKDSKTWQRTYDGSPIWKLHASSKMSKNVIERFSGDAFTIISLIYENMEHAFVKTWDELNGSMQLSFDFAVTFVKRLVMNFIDMVIDSIKSIIKEVILFIDIGLSTIGSSTLGGVGGHLRLSFVMDRIAIGGLLRWIIDNIEILLYNFDNPNNPTTFASIPREVPEHMYVRFEGYFMAGMSDAITNLADFSEVEITQIKYVVSIQANIPALVALVGYDWGEWSITFGVYLEKIESSIAALLFGPFDDDYVDIWFLKARIFEIEGG